MVQAESKVGEPVLRTDDVEQNYANVIADTKFMILGWSMHQQSALGVAKWAKTRFFTTRA